MQKIAIFWEKRFNKNRLFDTSLDPNLSPYAALKNILGDDLISYDLLESIKDKNKYTILCFLNLSLGSIKDYISFFIKYPKNKKYFFIFEPKVVALLNYSKVFHAIFDRIYTRNDQLVDNKKYFKFIYPSSYHGKDDTSLINFSNKKLITLINSNKISLRKNELYSEREKFIRYAEANKIDFDLYGMGRDKPNLKQQIFGFVPYTSYRGKVGMKDKVTTLSHYKFVVCFENMRDIPGLITEKIWDAFKAKSVPIYRGASNIEEYVPGNCFIDYRQFNRDYDKLISYISTIDEVKYNKYLKAIEQFLQTRAAQKWFDKQRANDLISSL